MGRETKALRRRKGMTMIEMMGVAVLLAVFAGMVGMAIFNNIKQGKISSATNEIRNLAEALELYANFQGNGDFPAPENWFDQLVKAGYAAPKPGVAPISGAYPNPVDPWGQTYGYCQPSRTQNRDGMIYSLGPDGAATITDCDSGSNVTPTYTPGPGGSDSLYYIIRVQ